MAPQPAVSPARILGNQLVDLETGDAFGDPVGNAEVQLAHGVGVGERGRFEGTRAQCEVDAGALLTDRGIEAVARHLLDEDVDRVVCSGGPEALATSGTTADLDGGVAGSDDLG